MGQGVWLGSENLGPMDKVEEVLKHGSLSVGFIGLAETLVALYVHHHGESDDMQASVGLGFVYHALQGFSGIFFLPECLWTKECLWISIFGL